MYIPVILGSVREGRRSIDPAKLMVERIKAMGHESVLVDFKEMPLPFFDSAVVPVAMKGVYPNENAQKWSGIALKADAFVLVVSEYNHGYSAVLKNALDWLYMEFSKKPFGMVGVSDGKFGAMRAMEQLRSVIENFGAFAIREVVPFGPVQDAFDQSGKLIDESYNKKIEGLLTNLVEFAGAMKPIRPNLN
ncbi:MAG: NAD(P)H-dependent oxidoreductase [Candidatus Doudnabacteria bacterium]|nr:NAD(P)H-dependent oxidoreductase [Candidatus Doudnabacteria bacterium]